MELPVINLTKEQLERMKQRIITEGTEGFLYQAPENKIYKIYKKPIRDQIEFNRVITEMIKRQDSIHLTSLPQGIVNVDGIPAGCILKHHLNYQNIDRMNKYSRETQRIILKSLLLKVQELVEHQIYPLDLNTNDSHYNNSGVIVTRKADVEVIDLDGSSVCIIYERNYGLENLVYTSLGELILRQMRRSSLKGPEFLTLYRADLVSQLSSSLHEEHLPEINKIIDFAYKKR